jgi:hypothetical protein
MAKHSHNFVETFDGFLGYGMDRRSNENMLQVCLQKFSDDRLMSIILKRMTDGEMNKLFEILSSMLKEHLSEDEYHKLFLKE